MVRAQSEHDNVDYAKDMRTGIYQLLSTDTFQHAKMFYAQRNLYLTGSVLFLGLILNRFHSMITELVKGTENSEAAKTSKEYMKMLDKEKEHDAIVDELKDKLKISEEKSKKADMLVKQAERTNEEYMKLTDRYVELEKRYEIRVGETGKGR